MMLLEHQGKTLLRQFGLPVPLSMLLVDPHQTLTVPFPVMIKAQISKGGRGKAGGIRRADTVAQFQLMTKDLLGSELLGCPVNSLLIEECLTPNSELYLAMVIDPWRYCLALLARRQGGVDVEVSSGRSSADSLLLPLAVEPDAKTVQQLADFYGFDQAQTAIIEDLTKIVTGMYQAAQQQDALLLEINPLMVCGGRLVCGDAKVEIDDAAAFRQQDTAYDSQRHSSQFVVLNEQGTVGSMANGAGLAMATVDAIQAAGSLPANFLDVGGGTDAQGMVAAFGKLAAMPKVAAIVINIFGGITRCDQVAEAIITARGQLAVLPPPYIRLAGTHQAEGQRLLAEQGIITLETLADCVAAAVVTAAKSAQGET